MGSLCCKDVEQEKIYVGVSRRSYKDRKNTIYQQILQYQEASLEVVSPSA